MLDQSRFWKFYAELVKLAPGFKIKLKNESLLMKILGFILFFNPNFMTGFVTTIGHTVYFPDHRNLDNDLDTLAHEFRHVYDSIKNPILFYLGYLFPQILVIFSFLAILSFSSYFWLFSLVFLVFLAPWPAPGRKVWEFNGYVMSLFIENELMKEVGLDELQRKEKLLRLTKYFNTHFIGFNYYKMWPAGVQMALDSKVDAIISSEILKEDVIYSQVLDALIKSKL